MPGPPTPVRRPSLFPTSSRHPGSMQTRSRAGNARGAGGSQGSRAVLPPLQRWFPVCPIFALHACLLVPPDTKPFPFKGVWPELRWLEDTKQACFNTIACKVLPTAAWQDRYDASAAGLCFFHHPADRCLRAKARGSANCCELPDQPDFLQQAAWVRGHDRWKVRLQGHPAIWCRTSPPQGGKSDPALSRGGWTKWRLC